MGIKAGALRALAGAGVMGGTVLFFMDVFPSLTPLLGRLSGGSQFFSLLIQSVSGAVNGAVCLGGVLLLVLFFGRIYCAVLCPLGIFQDGVIFLSRRFGPKRGSGGGKRPAPHYGATGAGDSAGRTARAPLTDFCSFSIRASRRAVLWYGLLALTTVLLLAGTLVMVNLLDPFSIFGRFCSQLFVPLKIAMHNLLVSLSEHFGVYGTAPQALQPVQWPFFWVVYGGFVLVVFMAFYHGRLYCNSLCPVGAFLSLLASRSVFQFTIDAPRCTRCGKCRRICRSHCIHPQAGHIDTSRCVACFDCVDVCPEQAIHFSRFRGADTRPKGGAFPADRRRLIQVTAAAGAGVLVTALPLRALLAGPLAAARKDGGPVTPPGSGSLDHFTSACIACQACVTACPEKVILPGFTRHGMAGMLQPHLDFNQGRCAYTCTACTRVCPSGALSFLSVEAKQRTRIGAVQFVKEKCLVHTHRRDCGACAEVCPTHAVYTVLENNIHHPRIKADACIGCGACQAVCPVNPKAIFVRALARHETAGPPFFPKPETPVATPPMGLDDAFPF